jgi:cytochrome c biogenesis protein ResB
MVKAIANKVLEFFLSLKTSVVLMLGLLFFFVAGALVMPVHPAFETINSVPLFEWLRDAPTGATWWLLGSIALLAALVANTLACSIESLIKKRSGRQWLLVISPQVIHIGFLLMLLGHLVSASGGFKANMFALEGTRASLPNGVVVKVNKLDIKLSPLGFPLDWRADIEYQRDGKVVKSDYSAPNRPSFFEGYGVYLKQVRPYPMRAALIEVTREPGAPWALGGGVIFMLGNIALVGLKMSREK